MEESLDEKTNIVFTSNEPLMQQKDQENQAWQSFIYD